MLSSSENLEHTGERLVPELSSKHNFWEHVRRYQFAAKYVKGKSVLDIASGEGYGTFGLKCAGAKLVVGVDVSPTACAHAIKKYKLDFRIGDAEKIPMESESVDLVVSFETIEHIRNPEVFLKECHRVLRNDGHIIISTPNRNVYSAEYKNPFHLKEWSPGEFSELLDPFFSIVDLYGQNLQTDSTFSRHALIASGSSFWAKAFGIRSIVWRLRRIFGESDDSTLDNDLRKFPERIIAARMSILEMFFSRYSVISYDLARLNNCEYITAIAKKK